MALIKDDDVIKILKLIDGSHFSELHLETDGLKLYVKRGVGQTYTKRDPTIKDEKEGAEMTVFPQKRVVVASNREIITSEAHPSESIREEQEEPGSAELNKDLIPIKAPMLGTFYKSPKPGAPAFVEVGQEITEDDVVCIIEVMKLFNSVTAGVRGRIQKVCVEDAQMVEFDQTLFLVEKATHFPEIEQGGS
jgi:acetyl-CoA carboxylase biotin carboxyl carrier protein